MLNIDDVTTFAFILMRMSGCVFLNPIFGRRGIPAIFKVGLSLLLSFTIAVYNPPAVVGIGSTIEFMVLLVKEFFVGFLLGFVVQLFLYIISFGGELIDMQMGMSMSKMYDPQSNVSLTLSATFYNILFMFLFFGADGHLTFMRLFINSANIVPFGHVAIGSAATDFILDLFCQCTVLAVKLAMPIIAIEIVVEMGIGLIMKAIPQINVFVVNIQTKVLVGFVLLGALYVPFANFIENVITFLFEQAHKAVYFLV